MKEKINSLIEKVKKLDYTRIYIGVVLFVMAAPFVLFFVMPSTSSTENKTLSSFPTFVNEDGKANINYMKDLSTYFEDRFAFRNGLVDLNSKVRAGIFATSPEDDVIVGSNGWLYYSATLDDYRGVDLSSERELYSMARNIKLIQEYVNENGASFVFTIAPNKNSLYPDNMPSSLKTKVSNDTDAKNVKKYLEKLNVNYVDLFETFNNENEILYLKRDSHWNKKGAVLAYNKILDSINYEHEDYKNINTSVMSTKSGDLNKMIYPVFGGSELEFVYDKNYSYKDATGEVTDVKDIDVTSNDIRTKTDNKEGSLVMYRDSFGNSLIDLFSEEFGNSYFSKNEPYRISDLNNEAADVMILEKVERHIQSLYKVAPLMEALKKFDVNDRLFTDAFNAEDLEYDEKSENLVFSEDAEITETIYNLLVSDKNESDENAGSFDLYEENEMQKISGSIAEDLLKDESRIFAVVSTGDGIDIYEAFLLNKNDYEINIPTENSISGVKIFIVNNDNEVKVVNNDEYSKALDEAVTSIKESADTAAKAKREIIEAEKREKEEAERLKKEEEERLRKEKEEAEKKAKEEEEAKKKEQSSSGKTIVSKTFYEDCGADTGYYEIVWSDGSVTYQDVN